MSIAANKPIKVGVVILNWQEYEATANCLSSLLAIEEYSRDVQLEIVICDNNSQDNSVERLENLIAGVQSRSITLIETKRNGGYAYGNNVGISYLLDHDSCHFIWLLNNDVEVCSKSLNALLESSFKDSRVLIWGSTLVDIYDRTTIECGGGYRYKAATGQVKGNYAGCKLQDLKNIEVKQHDFDYICGAAMFCRTEVFQQFGLLNDDYFLFFEEYDFIKKIGDPSKAAWCENSIVYHARGLSISKTNNSQRSELQQYCETLNTLKFTHKYYKRYLPSIFLLRVFIKPILLILRQEWHFLRPLALGLCAYFYWAIGKPTNLEGEFLGTKN